MAIHRLVLDDVIDDDYELIAVHSSIPTYRLAFILNKHLDLQLFRKKEDINFEHHTYTASFPLFQYHDQFKYNMYSLLGNKFKTKVKLDTIAAEGLFASTATERAITEYLIPELKNVDYFLKVEAETSQFSGKTLIENLLTIPQIVTAYAVDYSQLKSKNNLIFE